MKMFMSCTDDYGRQIQSTLKNRYDVLKRNIYAVLYGDPKVDIRPFPNNRGIPYFLNKEREVASQMLEIQDDELKDDPSKRLGRLEDVKAVVTLACQVASYYLDVKAGNPRLNVTDDYIRSFHELPHDERVRRLERKGATVYTIGFFIHFMFSTLRVYNDKDTAVHMTNTSSFNTTLAIKEIVLWLICAGQDCNKNNYKIAPDAQQNTWIYAPGCTVQPLISVPGVGISQLDPRNQEALIFVSDILNADDIEEFPVHSRDICRGPYGNRPARFFSGPVYMNGWPSAALSSSGGPSQKKAKHL
jgi:hypothetical protein